MENPRAEVINTDLTTRRALTPTSGNLGTSRHAVVGDAEELQLLTTRPSLSGERRGQLGWATIQTGHEG